MKVCLGEWIKLENEDDLLKWYPRHVYGTYRPQPFYEPERYPCLFKEVAIINNNDGSDFAVLAYLYEEEI